MKKVTSYKSANCKRAYKEQSLKVGTKYEQNIFITLEFTRENFQSVSTQTILGDQKEHYELLHTNLLVTKSVTMQPSISLRNWM